MVFSIGKYKKDKHADKKDRVKQKNVRRNAADSFSEQRHENNQYGGSQAHGNRKNRLCAPQCAEKTDTEHPANQSGLEQRHSRHRTSDAGGCAGACAVSNGRHFAHGRAASGRRTDWLGHADVLGCPVRGRHVRPVRFAAGAPARDEYFAVSGAVECAGTEHPHSSAHDDIVHIHH